MIRWIKRWFRPKPSSVSSVVAYRPALYIPAVVVTFVDGEEESEVWQAPSRISLPDYCRGYLDHRNQLHPCSDPVRLVSCIWVNDMPEEDRPEETIEQWIDRNTAPNNGEDSCNDTSSGTSA